MAKKMKRWFKTWDISKFHDVTYPYPLPRGATVKAFCGYRSYFFLRNARYAPPIARRCKRCMKMLE